MIRNSLRTVMVAILASASVGSVSRAQWSSNSGSNLKLADRSNEQVQPKIRATSDGGCFASWYDNFAGGYDVYLQRLDKSGVEQWPHNGLLIADRSVSSTVDYGLAVDAGDNGIIAFTDDRFGSTVTVQKVNSAGVAQWNGAQGVQLTPASTFGSPPSVAALSDGNYVVIWNTAASPIGTMIQKLNASGVPQFPGNGILQNDTHVPQTPLEASDVQASDNGSLIVLFVRCTGSNCVLSNKQLYVQKYDSTGIPLWNGGSPMLIMSGTASIQTGTFPRFVSDGSGGAVVAWYEIGGARNALMQHVLSNGSLKFAAPVSNVGPTNPASRVRVGAALAYNPTSGDYFVASPETDGSTQSQNSLLVQRIDSTGALQWGDSGVTLIAITTSTQPAFVQCQIMGDGVAVFWEQTTSASTRVIAGARVNKDASIAWNELPGSDGTTDKSRLDSSLSSCGFAMLIFGNGPGGSVDILAQNVLPNGALGNPAPLAGDMDCSGTVTVADIDGFVQALLDPAGYSASHSCCSIANADANHDSLIDGNDIAPFILDIH